MTQSLIVRHNIEMAHRLWALPGKCVQIHGHSWWCELTIEGEPDSRGILIDFADVKFEFRTFLDGSFDHHLALDMHDPLLWKIDPDSYYDVYPGLVLTEGMATVENMAKWIGEWAEDTFGGQYAYKVKLWEAATNAATWCS